MKTNSSGRRIGEDHPRAVMADRDVALLMSLLDERESLLGRLQARGRPQAETDAALTAAGLSYRCLAERFEISKSHVYKIASGKRRCQTPWP
ncbi:hypothetical protein ABS755_08000 [Castellaniella sp. FW104-16D08]|uniref:hypothetical protein n=1 Tax=unclassified Castellaniella TaxID=2617606 RepID=UPI003314AAF3